MKKLRKIIEINEELCNGCGQCVPDCAEGSLKIIDGKARLVADNLCDGLGACLGSCPTGALQIIERVGDEFDEKAVETFLKKEEKEEIEAPRTCPSSQLKTQQISTCQSVNNPTAISGSTLSHWPVRISLIPASAPFLENCDLLVTADCTAIAYPNINSDFVKGRVVMMGCPKFDDQPFYVDRFSEIFKTRSLNSLTVLIMEVPCCGAMVQIIKKALAASGADTKIRLVVISTNGMIIEDKTL